MLTQAMQMTFCQPTVLGLMLFHVQDEPVLGAWQSGEFYVDGSPKASLARVRLAAGSVHRGVAADVSRHAPDAEGGDLRVDVGQEGRERLTDMLTRLLLHRLARRPPAARHRRRTRAEVDPLEGSAGAGQASRHRSGRRPRERRAGLGRIRVVPLLLATLLALAGCGGSSKHQSEPKLTVGAVEDAAKWARDPGAQMQAAHDAGFRAIVLSALWEPGATADARSASAPARGRRRRVAKEIAAGALRLPAQLEHARSTRPTARRSRPSPRRSPASCPTCER